MKRIFLIFLCFVFFAISSFPVSAEDFSVDPYFVLNNGVMICDPEDCHDFLVDSTGSSFIKLINDELGYDITDCYYYLLVGYDSYRDRFITNVGVFDSPDGLQNNTLFIDSYNKIYNYNSLMFSSQGYFHSKNGALEFYQSNTNISFHNIYPYNNKLALFTNIPKFFYDGKPVEERVEFLLNVDYDEDYNCNISVTTNDDDHYFVGFGLVNPDYSHIEYSFFESSDRYDLSSSQPVNVSFNAKDFYDTCRDYPDYSDNLTIVATVYSVINDDTREVIKLLSEDINIKEILDQDNSLFSKRKEYIPLPSLDQYLNPFPAFPEWDSEHPLDSIWNIVKWVGNCVVTLGENFYWFFKWLGDCVWVVIQNIGIALYNLVFDIRRLLIYLFKPSGEFFNKELNSFKKTFNEKFSVISSVGKFWDNFWSNLDNNTNPPEWSFSWNGQDFLAVDFSMFSAHRETIHKIILAISWVLFLKYIYRSLPSLISSMPNL